MNRKPNYSKVVGPGIKAWIKQPGQDAVVSQRSNIAALVLITESLGVGKVLSGSQAAVLFADDVVYLATQHRILFIEPAVFASHFGS